MKPTLPYFILPSFFLIVPWMEARFAFLQSLGTLCNTVFHYVIDTISAISLGTHGWLSLVELSVHIHSFCLAPNVGPVPSPQPFGSLFLPKAFNNIFKSVL